MKRFCALFFSRALFVTLSAAMPAHGAVRLPAILSAHAVLQKSPQTAIWGWAEPDEKITVTLGKASAQTVCDRKGRWKALLDLTSVGQGPFDLVIKGNNQLSVPDVLIGDVWLSSGQSNMQFTLNATSGGDEEIARSANPLLRWFAAGSKAGYLEPQEDVPGHWVIAAPGTSGDCSGVAYYFGKKIQKDLKTPVGLVLTAVGGSAIQSWMSNESLDRDGELKLQKDKDLALARSLPEQQREFRTRWTEWLEKNGRADKSTSDLAAFTGTTVSTGGWIDVKVPGSLSGKGLPDAGAIWLRREMELSAGQVPVVVELGKLTGFETLYWNGEKIPCPAEGPVSGTARRYEIPARLVTTGKNIIALRIFSPVQAPSIKGGPNVISIGPDFTDQRELKGLWKAKAEFTFAAAPALAKAAPRPPAIPLPQTTATFFFNQLIHPLTPMTLRGVIWYQGEAHFSQGPLYRRAFPLLIQEWRRLWGQASLPFYFCQLPNMDNKTPDPGMAGWVAEVREAQDATLREPQTGEAILIDAGTVDFHPTDKEIVGHRLAMLAEAGTYELPVVAEGPRYDTMTIEKGQIKLRFRNSADGLISRPLPKDEVLYEPASAIQGFAICGADRKWVWARAEIEGDGLRVWSPGIPSPVAVRYAWSNNPTCNLYNRAGFPAAPFRTDDP